MELYDVVAKLIGPICPLGETHEDERRFANLQTLIELTDRLLSEIATIEETNLKRHEFSMKRAGEFCGKFLDRLGIHE